MRASVWQRWVRRPQTVWLRRAIFQVHLWSGIGFAVYLLMISVTGSVLVYRNELNVAATREPIISASDEPRLSDAELAAAAIRSYPGYRVVRIDRALDPDEAVDVSLAKGEETQRRLFDPRSGLDIGPSTPLAYWLVDQLAALHDDLFAGQTGRKINGIGAFALVLMAITGLTVWWPGIRRWRRSLIVRRGVGWKRFNWDLHSAVGFWTFGFSIVFGLSGIYLCVPDEFQAVADWVQPLTNENAGRRFVDDALYWLAYLHFGRINGIGIPCSGPGFCDQATKAIWALFGLVPAAMVVTGTIIWWNRVLRPWWRHRSSYR